MTAPWGGATPSASRAAAADRVEILVLGPPRILRGGREVRGFESRKAVALVCFLAATGRPCSRERLADLFWPSLESARARGNLSRVLNNVAGRLPGCLVVDRHAVALPATERVRIDTAVFTAAERGAAADADAAEAVLALARGELCEGLDVAGCPEWDAWLTAARESWRSRVADRLGALAGALAAGGRAPAALRCARRLVTLEPWREEGHRLVMRLLWSLGERSAALAQYEACRRALHESIGAPPDAETEALAARIRADAAPTAAGDALGPAAPAPPNNLPAPLTSFVGRGQELARLAALLADPNVRLVTILGRGGAGKTRLALEAARAAAAGYPDGVWLVPLASLASASELPAAIAMAAGLGLAGEAPAAVEVVEALGDRRILLILDTFEAVPAAVDAVIELLRGAPGCTVLATSRRRLSCVAEWLVPLEGLPLPGPEASPEPTTGALALLLDRLAQVAAAPADGHDLRAAARICRLVDGLPLGIELAAAQAVDADLPSIAAALDRDPTTLAAPLHDLPADQRSLAAVFDGTWAALNDAERAGLSAIATLPVVWDAAAATAASGQDEALFRRLAERLLLQPVAGDRWVVHESVRRFALAHLDDGAREAVGARHVAHLLCAVEAAPIELTGTPAVVPWYVDHLDHLRAALRFALKTGDGATAVRLAAAIWPIWVMVGHLTEGRAWLERALAAGAADAPPPVRGRALTGVGVHCDLLGDTDAARCAFEASLQIWRDLDAPRSLAATLNNLGVMADAAGDHALAVRRHEESLAIRRRLGVPGEIAVSLNNLGLALNAIGAIGPARARLEEALAIKRAADDGRSLAATLVNVGLLAAKDGDDATAVRLLAEAAEGYIEVGDRAGVAIVLTTVVGPLAALGHFEDAARIAGADAGLREVLGAPVPPADRPGHAAAIERIRRALGAAAFDAATASGRALDAEAAAALVVAAARRPPGHLGSRAVVE